MGLFFVYQCHMDGHETLYGSGYDQNEANEASRSLDSLIESGCAGDGCAVQGSLDREDDIFRRTETRTHRQVLPILG